MNRTGGGAPAAPRQEGSGSAAAGGATLRVRNLEVVYNDVALVLRGVSMDVPAGGIVALLGANGAGKTTLLRAITGLLPVHRAAITKGSIELDGSLISGLGAPSIVRKGVAQVMEDRRIFRDLTVAENLVAGGFSRPANATLQAVRREILDLLPVLEEKADIVAGFLSGGQQQMLAIGRALMSSPRLLLLDEPSLGLAPQIVEQVAEVLKTIAARGTTVLLVEQNAEVALGIATHAYVLQHGKVVLEGTSEEVRGDSDIQASYLGMNDGTRRSYREVKSYRKKKRWSS